MVAQLVKNLPAMRETLVQFLGWGRSLGERKGYPLQYSGLENSMDSPWGRKELDTTETFTSLHQWYPRHPRVNCAVWVHSATWCSSPSLQLDLNGLCLTREKAEDFGLPGKLVGHDQSGNLCPLPKQPVFMGKQAHIQWCDLSGQGPHVSIRRHGSHGSTGQPGKASSYTIIRLLISWYIPLMSILLFSFLF